MYVTLLWAICDCLPMFSEDNKRIKTENNIDNVDNMLLHLGRKSSCLRATKSRTDFYPYQSIEMRRKW